MDKMSIVTDDSGIAAVPVSELLEWFDNHIDALNKAKEGSTGMAEGYMAGIIHHLGVMKDHLTLATLECMGENATDS